MAVKLNLRDVHYLRKHDILSINCMDLDNIIVYVGKKMIITNIETLRYYLNEDKDIKDKVLKHLFGRMVWK